ncbi:MAG: hypothetical protein KDE27_16440 [Planctomycetes bacterium]|nr:hypothetical protein [Planctomycetota bacterium]
MTSSPPIESRPERWMWLALAAAAAVAFGWLVWLASQRIGYPFELEWMEGALVDHAARVADGRPIYCAPTPEHVPFLYAPMLFWLGGGLIAGGVDGLLALRLVAAAASIGVAMLIGHWVRKETGRVLPGLVASGVFCAGYGWLFWWYDLARNDSLFLLAMLGCGYALQHGGRFGWLVAAGCATFGMLAKQSAAMWLPAIGIGALILDWRRGVKFGIAGVGGIALALGLLHLLTGGWSTFYLFEMPTYHGWEDKWLYWTRDLWPMLPLVALGLVGFVAGCARGQARTALFLAAVGSGGIACSWLSRSHVGGFQNVLMYGFGVACVLGVAAAAQVRWLATLLFAQFGLLFWFDFASPPVRPRAVPPPAHRQAHEELLAYVRSQPRDVFVPAHGYVSSRVGKAASAHGQAIFDLMQTLPRAANGVLDVYALADEQRLAQMSPRVREALVSFRDGMLQAMVTKRYSALVLDEPIAPAYVEMFKYGILGPDMQPNTADDLYRRRPGYVISDPHALRPPVGYDVHSPLAYEAR